VFTRVHHWSLSWATRIHFMPCHPTSWRSVLILSYHWRLGFPSVLFRAENLYKLLFPDMRSTCLSSHSLWFRSPNNIWRGVQIMKLLIVYAFLSIPVTSSLLGKNTVLGWIQDDFFRNWFIERKGCLICTSFRINSKMIMRSSNCIAAYFLKARTVDPEKHPLPANGSETTFVSG
jgi:hypothetical protein